MFSMSYQSIIAPSVNKSGPVHPVNVLLPITAPPRRRSNSAIASWAAKVQPGSPAPRSPRRSSVCSASFVLVDTPSVKDFDLTNLGYSSVFVQFPITPSTPSPFHPKAPTHPFAHIPLPPVPASPPAKRRALKHFRSLSALTRTRAKSVSSAPMPPTPAPKSPNPSAARKKAQYKSARPAPLANELAMMQFADGGSLESHAQRVMAAQARAAGPGVGVGAVFRDANGGFWWDEDEEWEYAHLLANQPQQQNDGQWVQFGAQGKENDEDMERRGSVSTQDSDLDARYLVHPAEDDGIPTFVPRISRRTGQPVPAAPSSRTRRAASHLHKPEFLIDVAFGGPGPNPRLESAAAQSKPRGNARRRPAPLKLARPHAAPAPAPTGDVRRDFLAASFAPVPTTAPPPPVPASPLSPSWRPRRLSVTSTATASKGRPSLRNLFRRRE
ncbi:hypothetical protein B0H12DRAFT_1215786 [Mycena haematopus]|nr:hypothetical protein B0H12DRAFT_1215786 [Mycena haematopus]